MAKFIEVTLHGTNQVTAVNTAKIIKFWHPEKQDYTVIELDDGNSVTVKEDYTELWNDCLG